MTEQERQKLVKELRRPSFHTTEFIRKQAADEIERLARLVEDYKLTFGDIHDVSTATIKTTGMFLRPDTSTGLIEKVARAICLVRYNDPDRRMPICEENSDGPPIWTSYMRHARAAIEVMGAGITHEASHTDTENGEKSKC